MPYSQARASLVCAVSGRLSALSALRHLSSDELATRDKIDPMNKGLFNFAQYLLGRRPVPLPLLPRTVLRRA